MKPPINCAISYLTLQYIATFHSEGVFSTFGARQQSLIRKRHEWRGYGAVVVGRDYELNEANRKQAEQFHRSIEGEKLKELLYDQGQQIDKTHTF